MQELLQLIQANIQYAHFIIFATLLLAGLNIPVSEDVMIFISALLASNNPDYLPHLFIAVYLGAFFSDLISYSLGRFVGPKLFKIRFFAKMVSAERVTKISNYYQKYGVITLILGRFIPFGIRNALFLTAGLGKMNFIKFALSDLLACTISTISFFTLYFHYGESVINYIKQANSIIFALAIILLGIFWFRSKRA
ncbi:DedA family protein [Methyloprofundus sp.]|uniref:DedA family protein n=1 Tax=Methyloprofundus sp. TaxID=2020875 RepID=UPI003D0E24EC